MPQSQEKRPEEGLYRGQKICEGFVRLMSMDGRGGVFFLKVNGALSPAIRQGENFCCQADFTLQKVGEVDGEINSIRLVSPPQSKAKGRSKR